MPGFDISGLSAAMKVTYPRDQVQALYNKEAATLPYIKRVERKADHGLVMRGLFDLRRTAGAQAHAAGIANLPGDDRNIGGVVGTPGGANRLSPQMVQWSAIARRQSHLIRLDGEEMALIKRGSGAFLDAVAYRTESAISEMGRERNQQLFRVRNGRLARVTTIAGNVLTLTAPTAINSQDLSTSHLVQGMAIRAYSPDGITYRSGVTSYEVVTVDPANNQITINPAANADIQVGDQLVKGDDNSGAVNEEWDGFPIAFGDARWSADYVGTPRATYQNINGTVVDASPNGVAFGDIGGERAAVLFQRAKDLARRRGGSSMMSHFCARPEILREITWGVETGAGGTAAGAVSNMRTTPTVAHAGASKTLVHILGQGPIEVMSDVDATPRTIFAWSDAAVVVWEAIPMQWIDGYAGVADRFILQAGSWRYTAALVDASYFMALDPPSCVQIFNCQSAIDAA